MLPLLFTLNKFLSSVYSGKILFIRYNRSKYIIFYLDYMNKIQFIIGFHYLEINEIPMLTRINLPSYVGGL
ncbi:hypothetical protein SSOP1_0529 [Saccharolobus solfataricus]|uniref:Uncharacterized protein n=2 Tax=Saccharolobus solfataricus TaxID=2287 RepID=A0A157SY83_SACSO|nr:hypothetical protein SSOP1_0529 [Saccharolobus solfataricus]